MLKLSGGSTVQKYRTIRLAFAVLIFIPAFLSSHAGAATGVKAEWQPGGSAWTKARRKKRCQELLEVAALGRDRNELQQAYDAKDAVVPEWRWEDPYAYRSAEYYRTVLLSYGKAAMIEEKLLAIDAVITEYGHRIFTAQLRRSSLDETESKIVVTTDSQRTAQFASIPFVSSSRSSMEDALAALQKESLETLLDSNH
jgi:hypothetical protein